MCVQDSGSAYGYDFAYTSFNSFCLLILQLKSSLLLHIDGTSPVAEDIGRQVYLSPFHSVIIRLHILSKYDVHITLTAEL